MKPPFDIVYTPDGNYWKHTFISAYSIVKNNPEKEFIFHIISPEYNSEFFYHTDDIYGDQENVSFEYHELDEKLFESLPAPRHFSSSIYTRIKIPDILEDVDVALYLDGDTIIDDNIDQLLEISLSQNVIAGANHHNRESYRFGLELDSDYINTGVMIINCKLWRRESVGEKCINMAKNRGDGTGLPLQMIINSTLSDRIKLFSPLYNFTRDWAVNVDLERHAASPKIIHYTTHRKPWKYSHHPEMNHLYWKYREETPYDGYNRSLSDIPMYPLRLIRKSSASRYVRNLHNYIQYVIS